MEDARKAHNVKTNYSGMARFLWPAFWKGWRKAKNVENYHVQHKRTAIMQFERWYEAEYNEEPTES